MASVLGALALTALMVFAYFRLRPVRSASLASLPAKKATSSTGLERNGAKQEPTISSESIVRRGHLWQADFTAHIAAPEPRVFEAIRDIEKAHSEDVRSVRLVSQGANKKTVELHVAGSGGQTITTRLSFEYFPQEHRIVYRTLDGADFFTQAEYKLNDEGASTLMMFHETTNIEHSLPASDSVVKQVIRGTFLAQLEGLTNVLNLNSSANHDEEAEP